MLRLCAVRRLILDAIADHLARAIGLDDDAVVARHHADRPEIEGVCQLGLRRQPGDLAPDRDDALVPEQGAGTIARAYGGPYDLTDWYLPSRDELNEIYKERAVVGRTSGTFHTSTEINGARVESQILGTGLLSYLMKVDADFVHPVRAFG